MSRLRFGTQPLLRSLPSTPCFPKDYYTCLKCHLDVIILLLDWSWLVWKRLGSMPSSVLQIEDKPCQTGFSPSNKEPPTTALVLKVTPPEPPCKQTQALPKDNSPLLI